MEKEGGEEVKKLSQYKESNQGFSDDEKLRILDCIKVRKDQPMSQSWRHGLWKNLDERSEFIVRAVFGLTDDNKKWLRKDIAKELDISVESVKKALDSAIHRLFPEIFTQTEYKIKSKS